MEPLLLTAEETGHLLGISRTAVYVLMRKGDLQGVQIGKGSRRFPRTEIETYIARLQKEERRSR